MLLLLTFSDGIEIAVLEDDRQGTDVTVEVGALHRKRRQGQEVVGTFDSVRHLLVAVSTGGVREGGRFQGYINTSRHINIPVQACQKGIMSAQLTVAPGRLAQFVVDVQGKRTLLQTGVPADGASQNVKMQSQQFHKRRALTPEQMLF